MTSRPACFLPDRESVAAWMLCGSGNFLLEAATYGGIVMQLLALGCEQRFTDVVLGFNDLDSYVQATPISVTLRNVRLALSQAPASISKETPANHPATIFETILTVSSRNSRRKYVQLPPCKFRRSVLVAPYLSDLCQRREFAYDERRCALFSTSSSPQGFPHWDSRQRVHRQ
jgi:hypothetical protein